MVRRWKVLLILSTVLACYLLYQSQQSPSAPAHRRVDGRPEQGDLPARARPVVSHRTRKKEFTVSEAKCSQVKDFIMNSTMKILKKQKFFEMVKTLQGCPWTKSRSEHKKLQTKFQKCCNASYLMIMTQENTPMGYSIHYDAEKRTKEVTESLYSLFPKESPFRKPIKHCAVVGNGGILNGSFCGSEIDQADFVFRLNLPPMNWTDDVGTKTNLVTANPSILINKFSSLREMRKPFITMVREFGSSLILLPAFSFSMNTDVSIRTLYTIKDFDLKSKVVFFNPNYISNLTAHWKKAGLTAYRLSSGLMLASIAAEVCEKVTLYGFWPYSENLDGVWIPHHYYDNALPKPGFHSMSDEFYWYLQMHVQGALRLNLGQC